MRRTFSLRARCNFRFCNRRVCAARDDPAAAVAITRISSVNLTQPPAADLGAYPGAPPIMVGNVLYGTTSIRAKHGDGAVYGVDPSTGKQALFYRFQGKSDAQNPGNLIHLGGLLYGTSLDGGKGYRTILEPAAKAGRDNHQPRRVLLWLMVRRAVDHARKSLLSVRSPADHSLLRLPYSVIQNGINMH